jgi:hypothetical protein
MDFNIPKVFNFNKKQSKYVLSFLFYTITWMSMTGCGAVSSADDPATSDYWIRSQIIEAITAISKPPTKIEYFGAPYNLLMGERINPLTPDLDGVTLTSCTVSPDLPKGLSISQTTCTISGIPTEEIPSTKFTITGTNTAGSLSVSINIAIINGIASSNTPTALYYVNSPFSFANGATITTGTATLTGGAPLTCTSVPALPTGLSLNNTTCDITGTPTTLQSQTRYLITAANIFGQTSSSITIEIINAANLTNPFSYPSATYLETTGTPVNIVPSNLGGAAETCEASPTLPGGLELNQTSCAITGTPYVGQAVNTYTITATNILGTATSTVDIEIAWANPRPEVLVFPNSPYSFASGAAVNSFSNSMSGGTATDCEVTPALPAGLDVRYASGKCEIFGTPTSPTDVLPALYTITAFNEAGYTADTISLEIKTPPTSISYTGSGTANTLVLEKDTLMGSEGTATLGGGAPSNCFATPTLPTGLEIDPITCTIIGTPKDAQPILTYAIQSENSAGSIVQNITITINLSVLRPVSLIYPSSPYSVANGPTNTTITPTLVLGGATNSDPLTTCIANPTLPGGLVINGSTCVISGAPTTGTLAPTLYTITATNDAGSVEDTIYLEVVEAPLTLTYDNGNTLADELVLTKDVSMTQGVPTLTGGVPTTCTAVPTLPTGLEIDPNTCSITGTPTAIQDETPYVITATNSAATITANIKITVDWPVKKPVSIKYLDHTYSLAAGVAVPSPITPVLQRGGATGTDPVTLCEADPALPTGLTFTNATCVISGTPQSGTAVARTEYIITASNVAGSTTDTISLEIVVPITNLEFDGVSPSNTLNLIKDSAVSVVGVPTITGGVVSNCVAVPTLPTGLTLNKTTCEIAGTPIVEHLSDTYDITASNAAGDYTRTVTIKVDWPMKKPVSITFPSSPYVIPAGTTVTTTSGTVTPILPTLVLGGANPIHVVHTCTSDPALPTGLALDQATCEIINDGGTPFVASAAALYKIRAENDAGFVTDTISLEIVDAPTSLTYSAASYALIKDELLTTILLPTPTLAPTTSVTCTVVPSLPAGLYLDSQTCEITGTPTAVQTVESYVITASNVGGTVTANLDLTVDWPMKKPVSMVFPSSPYVVEAGIDVTVATADHALITPTIVLGGVNLVGASDAITACSSSPSLPTGLNLDPATCQITGTATASTVVAAALYTITASNDAGSVSDTISLEVVEKPTAVSYSDASNATANALMLIKDQAMVAEGTATITGGVPSSCTVSPSLPTGLVIDSTTCNITGTPTAVQPAPVTYTVTFYNGANEVTKDTDTFTIQIDWPMNKPVSMVFPSSPYVVEAGIDVTVATADHSVITPTIVLGGVNLVGASDAITACSSSPSLPTGLNLDPATCQITGTATASTVVAAALYTITASNDAGSVSDTISLEVVEKPTAVSYSDASNATANALMLIKDQAMVAEGTATITGGVPSSCTVSPSLPTGLVIDNTTCNITGTPTAVQPAPVTYTVTFYNGANEATKDTDTFTIQIDWPMNKPVSMVFPSSPYVVEAGIDVTVATADHSVITPTIVLGGVNLVGASDAITACSSSPSLPTGLNLDPATCQITGTATASTVVAAALYTITASNDAGSVSDTISLEVVEKPTAVSYSDASNATANALMLIKDQAMVAEGTATITGGVPSSCTVSPSLPTGLVIDNTTCNITGTPTAVQPAPVTYTVTFYNGANEATKDTDTFTIQIDWPMNKPVSMVFPSSPYVVEAGIDVTVATADHALITPTIVLGGVNLVGASDAITACSSSPSLPTGLNLDPATCQITGTATASTVVAAALYTITASNDAGSVSDTISLEVVEKPTAVSYSDASNATANALMLIKDQAMVAEGTATITGGVPSSCTVSPSLPTGLVIDSTTCNITGTPTAVQPAPVTYTVTFYNGANEATKDTDTFTIQIDWPMNKPVSMVFPSSPYVVEAGIDVTVATADHAVITPTIVLGGVNLVGASDAITACSSSPSLPTGLNLDPATCQITGTATASTVVAAALYTITASNDAGSVSDTISLEVVEKPTAVSYSDASNATANALMLIKDQAMVAEGTATITGGVPSSCTVSPSLPTGLVIDNTTCNITGTPLVVQETPLTYTVTFYNGANEATKDTDTFTIQIDWSVVKPGEMSYPSSPYVVSDSAAVSITPTFAVGGGTPTSCISNPSPLPGGLTLNSATCEITGTPTGVAAAALYTITATNLAGSVNDTISLAIVTAPTALTYNGSANANADVLLLIKDQALTNEGDADLTGGTPFSCAVTPSLPTGLVIDDATCDISGTPLVVQETAVTYIISASNAANTASPLTRSITIQIDWSVLKPAILIYPSSPYVLGKSIAMSTITPALTGGGGIPATCTSIPPLPTGLNLNSTTCALSGTPTATSSTTSYIISASNMAGSATDVIEITVVDAPSGLSYNSTTNVLALTKGHPLTTEGDATIGGGAPITCTADPTLPSGLSLDPVTCDITGNPQNIQSPAATHRITATNPAGSVFADVNLSVDWATPKPDGLVFPSSPYVVADGSSVTITSNALTGGAATSCSSSSPLPSGLSVSLSSGTCEISGTPAVASDLSGLFTITALNLAGSVSDTISLSVVKTPMSITYSGSPYSFVKGTAISTITPSTTGTPTGCSVTPTLPTGLILDNVTCDISGTPLDYSPNKTYSITSSNPKGNATTTIDISVDWTVQPPNSLTFTNDFISLERNVLMTDITSSTMSGGAATTCSTNPSLPAGLAIRLVSNTCEIYGTPTTNQTAKPYSIIATNEAGSISTSIVITISDTVVAPTSLSYGTAPVNKSLVKGVSTTIPATISGGTPITSCSTSPTLPGGLSISSTTCDITGTPYGIQGVETYTVTASNSAGSATATLFIEVNYSTTAPTSLVYYTPVYALTINQSATISPVMAGGTPTTCTASPTLPTNLSIHPNTCEVLGTPTALSANTTYTITATNIAGTSSSRFDLSVNAAVVAPSALSYAGTPYSFTKDTSVSATPTYSNGTPTSCTVKIGSTVTTLPGGLSIDPSTCAISGTPYAVQPATTYTITAANSAGNTDASISIAVAYSTTAPTSLIYSATPLILEQDRPMANTSPSISGGTPTTCTISPTIAGVNISTSCVLSGAPTTLQASTAHTITATNEAGTTTTSLYISVVPVGTATAPTSLVYGNSPLILKKDTTMTTQTPTLSGGTPTSCTISPAIPTTLSINSTTCAISGTPDTLQAYTTYTVTASNSVGSTTTSLKIAVALDNVAPTSISYGTAATILERTASMTPLTPTIAGGIPTACTISPTIPTGLSIDSTTCAISGAPSVLQGYITYTVTASNLGGTTSTSLRLAVADSTTAPATLAYNSSQVILVEDIPMTTYTPTITGGTPASCTISPAIPNGLSIHATTCAISGTPDTAQGFTAYTITATNLAGSTTTSLSLAVSNSNTAPTSLIYASTSLSLVLSSPMTTLTPTISGGTPTSCTITPTIPTSLNINGTTCAISGTPNALSAATNYTVTATNLAGSTTATLSIAVVNAVVAPSALTYSAIPTFTVNSAITTITPSISGTAPTSCTSTPTLPGGLSLNPITCAISGTPYSALEAKTFTIEASNSAGSTTANITITISSGIVAPTSITYSGTPFSLTNGAAMNTATPVIVGGTPSTCFTIPPLPTGLSISNTTCAISGGPTVNQATTSYNVVAYNSSNAYAYTTISITIGVYAYSWGTFTDNFNGTVSFVKDASYTAARNVLWMKCSYGQTYSGGTCSAPNTALDTVFCGSNDGTCDDGTSVTSTTSGSSTHIYTACNSYNAGAGTFGKTTWRVPTKEELTSLLLCSNGPGTSSIPANPAAGCTAGNTEPAINTTLFPNTVNSDYWTSSVFSSSQSYSIGFRYGSTWTPNKSNAIYLRCVSDP